MTKLKDIVFETDHYWVKRVPKGFEVYKTGLTHSTRVAVIGYTGDKGLERAKDEIARREASGPSVRHHATKKKSSAQLEREIKEALAEKPSAEGYRVAYVLVTRRDGKIVPVRAIVDAPRALTMAEAEAWRRKWGRGETAWIETMDGRHVPVKGAKRPGKFIDDARQGDVHAMITASRSAHSTKRAARVFRTTEKHAPSEVGGRINLTITETLTPQDGGVVVERHVTGMQEGRRVDDRFRKFYPGVTMDKAVALRFGQGYVELA